MEQTPGPRPQNHEIGMATIIRRGIGMIALAAGCGLAGAYHGAMTPTEVAVGPHIVEANATQDGAYTLDLFDHRNYFRKPTSGSKIGAHLRVTGLPGGYDFDPNSPIPQEIINQYKQLLDNPEHVGDRIQTSIINHAKHEATLDGLGMLSLELLALTSWQLIGDKRRHGFHELFSGADRLHRPLAILAASTMMLGMSGSEPVHQSADLLGNPIFADTELVGTSVHGPTLQAITDKVAPELLKYFKETTNFYHGVGVNFERTFDTQIGSLPTEDGIQRVLVLSDKHCNISMDKIFGKIAKRFGTSLTIDAGDVTLSGTVAEQECISSEHAALKAHPLYVTPGNHDSRTSIIQMQHNGFIVADGKTSTNSGFRILGDHDPDRSTIGTPIHQAGSESINQLSERLAQTACNDRPDILVVHQPEAAQKAVEEGCVKLVVSGHTHNEVLPIAQTNSVGETSYQFIQGTSGGAKKDGLTIGPLRNPAIMTIFNFDKQTKKPLGYYTVTVAVDGNVSISPLTLMPMPIN